MPVSWKPEVTTVGDNGVFTSNGLRFATEQEARSWAYGLMCRWFLVVDFRATESDDAVNYRLNADGTITEVNGETVVGTVGS